MEFGCDTTRDRVHTTCTRSTAILAVLMPSRACTRTWLPGIVPASARSTYVYFPSNRVRLFTFLSRFSVSSRSRRLRMCAAPTSSSSWSPISGSLSPTVSSRRARPSWPTAPLPSKGREWDYGVVFCTMAYRYANLICCMATLSTLFAKTHHEVAHVRKFRDSLNRDKQR